MFLVRTRPITIRAATPAEQRPASGRWIDPRAQRLGAATSAAVLLIALGSNTWAIGALVGVDLALSAGLGTRWFVFSRPWPMIRHALAIGPSELEHEMPPRFAQALGAAFVSLAVVLLTHGVEPWGWLPVVAVIALQVLLAATGFCLGCRLFFLRWWVPDLFARLVGRGIRREALLMVDVPD